MNNLLHFGYIKFAGPINTQYLIGNKDVKDHKALAHYLGFFGFGFDEFPEELKNKHYIQIPITSDSEKDQGAACSAAAVQT